MSVLTQLSKIRSLKSEKGKGKFLSNNTDREFWFGLKLAIDPFYEMHNIDWESYKASGKHTPIGTFEKIMDASKAGKLEPYKFAQVMEEFAKLCRKQDWEKWYRPILEGKFRVPLSIDLFNKHCPEDLVFTNFNISTYVEISDFSEIPEHFYMEPLPEENRLLFLVERDKIQAFYATGERYEGSLIEYMYEKYDWRPVSEPVVLDTGSMFTETTQSDYIEVVLNDIIMKDDFINKNKTVPYEKRRTAMQSLAHSLDETEMSFYVPESYKMERGKNIVEMLLSFDMFISQGFEGVLFRDAKASYHDNKANIVVRPNKSYKLLCTGIKEECISGMYGVGNKKVTIGVSAGLTSKDREQLTKDKEAYIGREFEVLACGLSKNNALMFPVFQQWRK